jgi:peptidoglycan/LPS O-acetylase OafA/YrhL
MSARNAALDSLTGLRWWAAFAVFFFHMTAFAPIPIFPIFEYGNYGVMFFFVLSGFVLSWSWKADLPVRAFYLRRVGRIWPSAFIALLLAIPVFYSFNPDPAQWWVKPFDLGILLLSVPLIQGWWLAPAILFSGNPAAWTLTCEFFFYSLHPLFQRAYIRISSRAVLVALALLFVGIVVVKSACFASGGQGCVPLPLPIERLPEFIIGMGIGVLAKRGKLLRLSPWIPLAALGALFVFLSFGSVLPLPESVMPLSLYFANEVTLFLMALTIASVAQRDVSGRKTGFKSSWLVKLGEVSFAFYLVHATVMYVFVDVFGQLDVSWKNLTWYPIVLAAGLVIAFALHAWVEKPFEKKIRRFSDRIKLSQ